MHYSNRYDANVTRAGRKGQVRYAMRGAAVCVWQPITGWRGRAARFIVRKRRVSGRSRDRPERPGSQSSGDVVGVDSWAWTRGLETGVPRTRARRPQRYVMGAVTSPRGPRGRHAAANPRARSWLLPLTPLPLPTPPAPPPTAAVPAKAETLAGGRAEADRGVLPWYGARRGRRGPVGSKLLKGLSSCPGCPETGGKSHQPTAAPA